jgi:hypothetical protein
MKLHELKTLLEDLENEFEKREILLQNVSIVFQLNPEYEVDLLEEDIIIDDNNNISFVSPVVLEEIDEDEEDEEDELFN